MPTRHDDRSEPLATTPDTRPDAPVADTRPDAPVVGVCPDAPVAGARFSPLQDLMYGHIYADAVRAVIVHGIADLLADGPRTAEELAERSGTQAVPLRRILRMLATRGLFREENGAFALTENGTGLRADVPGSQRATALLFTDEMFRRSAENIPDTLRTGEPGFETAYGLPFFTHLSATPDKSRLFDAAMTSRTGQADEDIANAYPFPDSGTVVDIGGGRGGLLREALTRSPGLRGVLFDRPETVADHLLDTEELAGRWRTEGGDFFTAVPKGGDVYLLKNILHDWPDEDCLRILRTIRQAVTPGTRLLVVDAVLPADGSPHPALALDIVMLMVVRGRERTAAEFQDLLTRSGFHLHRILPTRAISSIIEAEAKTDAESGPLGAAEAQAEAEVEVEAETGAEVEVEAEAESEAAAEAELD